jgi:hypothetical protein
MRWPCACAHSVLAVFYTIRVRRPEAHDHRLTHFQHGEHDKKVYPDLPFHSGTINPAWVGLMRFGARECMADKRHGLA